MSVRVVANARAERVEVLAKGRLKISVREPAARNIANTRAHQVLAAHLNLPLARVRLVGGHHSPSKIFSVE